MNTKAERNKLHSKIKEKEILIAKASAKLSELEKQFAAYQVAPKDYSDKKRALRRQIALLGHERSCLLKQLNAPSSTP